MMSFFGQKMAVETMYGKHYNEKDVTLTAT